MKKFRKKIRTRVSFHSTTSDLISTRNLLSTLPNFFCSKNLLTLKKLLSTHNYQFYGLHTCSLKIISKKSIKFSFLTLQCEFLRFPNNYFLRKTMLLQPAVMFASLCSNYPRGFVNRKPHIKKSTQRTTIFCTRPHKLFEITRYLMFMCLKILMDVKG